MRIAFAGEMESGKTTVAEYLQEIYGFGIVSFADKLKFNLIDIGINIDRCFEKKDDNSRALMQLYGEAMRDQNPLHWVNFALEAIEFGEEMGTDGHAIDDLRYLNEADELRELGFTLVRIRKDGPAPMCNTLTEHVSENEWKEIDFDFDITAQDGDLPHLFEQVDDVVNEIIKKGGE